MRLNRFLLAASLLLSGAAALLGAARIARADAPAHRLALLIGINDYKAPEIRDLQYGVNDAAELGKTLEANGFTTRVVTSDREPVSKQRILSALAEIGKQAQPGDVLLVLFSGRGAYLGPGPTGGAYFLPQDCSAKDAAALRASALAAKELKGAIDAVKASRRVLLADAAGGTPFATAPLNMQFAPKEGFGRDLMLERRVPPAEPEEVSVTALACAAGKPSYDAENEKRGLFAYMVERALSAEKDPKALDAGQRLTLMSFVRYIRNQVPEATRDRPTGPQQPEVYVQGAGPDFLLVDPIAVAARKGPQPMQDPVFPPDAASRHALVIGFGDYKAMPKLPSAPDDAQAVRALLTGGLGFPAGQVLLLGEQQESRPGFWGSVKKWLAGIQPGGLVAVYYAGHGRKAGGEDYLVLPVADAYPEYVDHTSISLDQLLQRIDARRPKQILGFLDMARGPGDTGFHADKKLVTAARTDLFYAGGEGELGRDSREAADRGVFTEFLIEALRGDPKALGSRGRVTFDSLRTYLRENVSAYVNRTYQAAQTPELLSRVTETGGPQPPPLPTATDYHRRHDETNRPPGIIIPDPEPPFSPAPPKMERKALAGHTDAVKLIVFAPGGRALASASPKEICLWDVAEAKLLTTLNPGGAPSALAFSPDGKTLAAASSDLSIHVWNVEDGKELRKLSGHQQYITSLAFSPDGKLLASGSWDATAVLWDAADGRRLTTLASHSKAVNQVAFSPDSKTLATASADGTARLWDSATGREIAVLSGHTDAVKSLAFSPDGTLLATGSGNNDRSVRLWDGWTGSPLHTFTEMPKLVALLAFSTGGDRLVGVSNTIARVWNVQTRQEAGTLEGHNGIIYAMAAAPDNRTVATGGEDDEDKTTLLLWDAVKAEKLPDNLGPRLPGPVEAVAFAPQGQALAAGTGQKSGYKIVLWRPAPGSPKPGPRPKPAGR